MWNFIISFFCQVVRNLNRFFFSQHFYNIYTGKNKYIYFRKLLRLLLYIYTYLFNFLPHPSEKRSTGYHFCVLGINDVCPMKLLCDLLSCIRSTYKVNYLLRYLFLTRQFSKEFKFFFLQNAQSRYPPENKTNE